MPGTPVCPTCDANNCSRNPEPETDGRQIYVCPRGHDFFWPDGDRVRRPYGTPIALPGAVTFLLGGTEYLCKVDDRAEFSVFKRQGASSVLVTEGSVDKHPTGHWYLKSYNLRGMTDPMKAAIEMKLNGTDIGIEDPRADMVATRFAVRPAGSDNDTETFDTREEARLQAERYAGKTAEAFEVAEVDDVGMPLNTEEFDPIDAEWLDRQVH